MFQFLCSLFHKRNKPAHPLDSLPVELLLQIAGYLAPSLRDINALVRTTRVLYQVFTPMLYRDALRETDNYGRSIIRFAAARGNAGLLRRLLRHGCLGIDGKERNTGTTSLHSAIILGHSAAVRVLLDRGAGVEVADRRGWTALHWAVLYGDCRIVREVLYAGARVGHGTRDGGRTGTTALHMAAARGDAEMVVILVQHGASVEALDEYGLRPVDLHDGRGFGSSSSVDQLAINLLGATATVMMRMAGCKMALLQKCAMENRLRIVQLHEIWYSRLM